MVSGMRIVGLSLVMLIPAAALAQQISVDPRITPQTIAVLQNMLNLRDAQIRMMNEDSQAQIKDLTEKCGDACKPKSENKPTSGTEDKPHVSPPPQ